MASISTDSRGNRRLLFTLRRKRYALHLGQIPMKTAEGIRTKVESLLASSVANLPLDGMTSQWLAGLDDAFHARLSSLGLAPPRQASGSPVTLAKWIDRYHTEHPRWKPNSVKNHAAARRWLVAYFGSARHVGSITEADAERFRLYLGETLSENTLRRLCGFARQYFRAMVRERLIDVNPFGSMKRLAVDGNQERFHFVSRSVADRVLAACPDAEWRLIFGLCRYGGFRCPSEHNALRWQDIDFARKRITLHSPKTGKRTLPLFPELMPLLQDMPRQGERVFPDYQYNINLRHHFYRILKVAGITPWPKIFQNLRSTRETELMEQHPAHVVCAWIGNTVAVARRHYLQVTEEHFEKATQIPTQKGSEEAGKFVKRVTVTTRKQQGMPAVSGGFIREGTPDRSRTLIISKPKSVPFRPDDADSDALIGF